MTALGKNVFLAAKPYVNLPFEQQRFYNPHHHPEMPRRLQSFGPRVGHGEDYTRIHPDTPGYTMIRAVLSL